MRLTFSPLGRPARTVRSDQAGRYEVQLQPGTYQVSVPGNRPIMAGRVITVEAGRDLSLDITYDSGLRIP